MTETAKESVAALEARGLSCRAGGETILADVSFVVAEGEYWTVIGPNGAGKTTLLRCLDRVVRADGLIEVFGRPLRDYSQRELGKLLSYVPQAEEGAIHYTVLEYVLMGRYPHLSAFSSYSADDLRKAREVLDLVGMVAFADRLLTTLSGGERQKVSIAAALAQEARILLLDEPTTYLDYRHQTEVLELLLRLNRDAGLTVISVTHDLNQASFSSDRILALKHGAVKFLGSPTELLEDGHLEAIYDTRFDILEHPTSGSPIVVASGAR